MSPDNVPAPRPAPDRRERVLDILSKHYAAGRIELEEMERRMEIAARAATAAELESALAGLVRPEGQPAAAPGAAVATARPASRRTLAIMGGHHRAGRWNPPRFHQAAAIMGGIQLDYREAVFEEGTSEIELFVFWGGVQLIVPPDLDVEVDGSAILGGLNDGSMSAEGGRRTGPRLKVHARVIMGGVDVKIMDREDAAASPPGTPRLPGTT